MSTSVKSNTGWIPAEPKQSFPEFLQKRVDKFFNGRVKNEWGGRHIMRGLEAKPDDIHISNNDYLSLAQHPEVVGAQVRSLQGVGNGDMKGAIFLHGDNIQRVFELKMAEFMQADDVLLSQSGWCANVGLIQSIAEENVPVYIDMIAHMSLWEGIHSAKATAKPFRHNDHEHLERLMEKNGRGVVVVDSLYSTNGDICPLEHIVEIAEKYDSIIIVDESHSLGTYGHYGEGMTAFLGLTERVHYRTSSLAKAFPGRGGLIACSSKHREYLIFESLPAIFSSALLPHDIAGYIAMIDVIKKESWRRSKLHRTANYIREELDKMGYNITPCRSQIIGLESGTEAQTIILRDALEENGIFGSVFCAPATPKNRALMRLSLNAALTPEQAEKIVRVCYDIRDKVDMANWASTLRKERDKKRAISVPISEKLLASTHYSTPKPTKAKVYALNRFPFKEDKVVG